MTNLECTWRSPPVKFALMDNEVHVWRAYLDLTAEQLASLECTLSADEQERAARFYFQKDREHFCAAHGALRDILSRYLSLKPGELSFRYSSYGKPALTTELGEGGLHFNLAHSNGLALYAVTQDREVGIDVEYIRAEMASERVAERFFSPYEVARLRALPEHMQIEAFFNCWTRKEAYLKARGEGLSLPLDQFDVSLTPGESPLLEATRGDPQEAGRWSLQELAPGTGYVASLAVEGHTWSLKCWQWPGDRIV